MSNVNEASSAFDCLLIVHSGEISIKSNQVRRQMLQHLRKNILNAVKIFNVLVKRKKLPLVSDSAIHSHHGRLYINYSLPRLLGRWLVQLVTGIAYCAPCTIIPTDVSILTSRIVDMARVLLQPHQSFALRVRREGRHEFTSQELAIQLGGAIQRELVPRPTVDLTNPDVEIFLDVRGDRTFVFAEKIKGAGGLPQGSQGVVMAELLPHPHELAAALAMMRRGVALHPVIFDTGKNVDYMKVDFPQIVSTNVETSPHNSRSHFDLQMSLLTRLLLSNYVCGYKRYTLVRFQSVLRTILFKKPPMKGCTWCLGTRRNVLQKIHESQNEKSKGTIRNSNRSGLSEDGIIMGLSFEEGLKINPSDLFLIQQLFKKEHFTLFIPSLTLRLEELQIIDFPSYVEESCCPFQNEFQLETQSLKELLTDEGKSSLEKLSQEVIIEEKTIEFMNERYLT